jgi:hypothetical protein
VPATLAAYHHPGLVGSLLQRVLAAVREPARAVHHEGRPAWRVAGISLLQFDASGDVRGWLWRPVNGRLALVPIPERHLTLHPCPAGTYWLEAIVRAAELEIYDVMRPESAPRPSVDGEAQDAQADDDDVDEGLEAYLVWLFRHLRMHLRRHADLRLMRRRVADALALDATTLRLARTLQPTVPFNERTVKAVGWNLAVRHRAALCQVQRDLPQVLPLYGALLAADILPAHTPQGALQAIKRHLATYDIHPATWRLLTRSSVRLLLGVRTCYGGQSAKAMINHLRTLQLFGLRDEPAPELIASIWARDGHTNCRWPDYTKEVGAFAAIYGHVARCYGAVKAGTPGAELPRLRETMHQVIDWARETQGIRLGKNERRAGWRWLVRTAEAWRADQLFLQEHDDSWDVPAPKELGDCRLVMLRSRYEIREEGLAMHHCAADYGGDCVLGSGAMVSIREVKTGRRLATALYCRYISAEEELDDPGTWLLFQVRGPLNAVPSPGLKALAKQAESWVAEWMLAQPRPAWPQVKVEEVFEDW